MTPIGTILDGKYEILKEIGRGGMSIVYLANDTHLNRNWAVKEVRKQGNGKNDEIVINSLLAEADMVKRLDHPALPRIVDIIDNGTTIYIIMDFIEGESLDKIIKEYGVQPEEKVIEWGMQICDVLSYLHSQKPPIIYRDMKPANVMLKPNGNICIIDFGIAREYKEQNLADTTVLGTKGYAPPEQYSGQTDARSDIYALGMTMHQLLTGVDPRNGEVYAPVRYWNPALGEGIEAIINRCVEPAPENRYQDCAELLLDLQDPSKVTRGWRKRLRRRLWSFLGTVIVCVFFAGMGIGCNLIASKMNNQDYDIKINSSSPSAFYEAVDIYPNRTEAYDCLVQYYKNHDAADKEISRVGNSLEKNMDKLNSNDPEVAKLYYDVGKLYFAEYDGALKVRCANAKGFFDTASSSEAAFEKKEIAQCYASICDFMTSQSTTSEHSLEDYEAMIDTIAQAMDTVDASTDNESNYDKMSLYYSAMLFLNDQSRYLAGVGYSQEQIMEMMQQLYQKSNAITSTLVYVTSLQDSINRNYEDFVSNITRNYHEVAKRQNGGAAE